MGFRKNITRKQFTILLISLLCIWLLSIPFIIITGLAAFIAFLILIIGVVPVFDRMVVGCGG